MNSKTVNVYTIQTTNDDPPSFFKDDEIDFDNCNLTEVIKFLQKIAKLPDASKLNVAFTKHITDALIKARDRKSVVQGKSVSVRVDLGGRPSRTRHTRSGNVTGVQTCAFFQAEDGIRDRVM